MLSVSVSLENIAQAGSVLGAVLGNPGTAQLVANSAAESYTSETLDWIAAGKAFTPRHGGAGLEGAISWHPLGNGGAVVYVNKLYAQYVEEGTGIHAGHQPWVIGPKEGRKALKIPTGGPGGYVIRSHVTHPGSKPFPFFYADREHRNERMAVAGRSLLLRKMANG